MSLIEDTAQGADWNLALLRNNDRIDNAPNRSYEFDVATLLSGLLKAAASSRRLTSRKWSGLSRPNLDLNRSNDWRASRPGRLEVQFERFLQVRECLLFSGALARDIDFQTLRDKPLSLAPNRGGKRPFHTPIVP